MSKQLQSKLKKARSKAGKTQEQMAKLLGVPLSTLTHWEQDKRTPRGLAAQALEAKLQAILADG